METRDRFITAALRLFAEKGFYGASMDQIARDLGLTKQALIHHFGTKEKLYGAVLTRISERLLEAIEGEHRAFPDVLAEIYAHTLAHSEETQLLMRELLDNRRRADQAGAWYLRPFLDGLRAALKRSPAWADASTAQASAHVYQLLGAITYFAVSVPTLSNMYSRDHVETMKAAFPARLRRLAEAGPNGHNDEG
jgi:AcrR family transcriptional regulator